MRLVLAGIPVAIATFIALAISNTPPEHVGVLLKLIMCFISLVVVAGVVAFSKSGFYANYMSSEHMGTFFIPGYKLFDKDMKKAQDRPDGWVISFVSTVVLIAVLIGGSPLGYLTLLPQEAIGDKYYEWYLWGNRADWLYVYSVQFATYVVTTLVFNGAVWLIIKMAHQIKTTERLEALTVFFDVPVPNPTKKDEDPKRWLSQLKNIYGHKTWSGPNTYKLLKSIQESKDRLGTSSWFLLQFAADTLEYHVKDGSKCITFTYDDEKCYSKFLADSMGYCSQSMIWITDRNDFSDKLFPMLIREVVLSIASELASSRGDENLISQSLVTLKTYYDNSDPANLNSEAFDRKCLSCANDKKKKCQVNSSWDSVLDAYARCWANDILERDIAKILSICAKKSIIASKSDTRESDRFAYPHMRKYYEHPVSKTRIIDIPNISGWDTLNNKKRCGELLKKLSKKDTEYIVCVDRLAKLSTRKVRCLLECKSDTSDLKEKKNIARRHIFLAAWELFEHFSNSDTKHKVVGFAMVDKMIKLGIQKDQFRAETFVKTSIQTGKGVGEKRCYFDIGIYDKHVMVRSKPIDKGRREVSWSIIQDSVNIFDSLDPLSDQHNDVLPLSEFTTFLGTVITDKKDGVAHSKP